MNELLQPQTFPQLADRPYFITSYVSTIDGKIFVDRPGYWPIGSRNDWTYYTWIRAHADIILEGKNTALKFGGAMIKTLNTEPFLTFRKQLGKTEPIKFMVVSTHPDQELKKALTNPYGFQTIILTSGKETFEDDEMVKTTSIGEENKRLSPQEISAYLHQNKYKIALLDTGSQLFSSFLTEKLVDEIFLTISPKIFGDENNQALSVGDGKLFTPEIIPQWTLVNSQQVVNEIFLRYKFRNNS